MTTYDQQPFDGTDTPVLLDRQIDDLLLYARGLAVVRDLLAGRGASRAEIDAHSRKLESTRARLAELVRGAAPEGGLSRG